MHGFNGMHRMHQSNGFNDSASRAFGARWARGVYIREGVELSMGYPTTFNRVPKRGVI